MASPQERVSGGSQLCLAGKQRGVLLDVLGNGVTICYMFYPRYLDVNKSAPILKTANGEERGSGQRSRAYAGPMLTLIVLIVVDSPLSWTDEAIRK